MSINITGSYINIENLHVSILPSSPEISEISDARLTSTVVDGVTSVAIEFLGNRKSEQVLFHSKSPVQPEPTSYGSYLAKAASTGACIDVQPINGISKSRFLKNLFRNSHVQDLTNQLNFLKTKPVAGCRVFVLDVKDSKGRYENSGEIQQSEEEVIQFAKGPRPKEASPRQAVHDLLRNEHVEYVFLEGRLKNRVITHVATSEQADFLQNSARGREVMCMLCELIMNLFKKGYDVHAPIQNGTQEVFQDVLAPEDFVAPLQDEVGPALTSIPAKDIVLHTLYPEHYKELYGPDEQYFKAVSSMGYAKHEYDPTTGTTSIQIGN